MAAASSSRFQGLLRDGAAVWCVNPGGASLDVLDMLARVGVRCVFIDCERSAIHIESVTAMVRCAHSHGMAAMLRSESSQPEILVRYLDRGIDALVVPHTETESCPPAQAVHLGAAGAGRHRVRMGGARRAVPVWHAGTDPESRLCAHGRSRPPHRLMESR